MTLSQSARAAVQAEVSAVVPITLITITHPDLDAPIRLSTDPTERLSVDPLRYGTRHQGAVYWYALVSAPWPGAGERAEGTVTMTVEIVAPEMETLTTLSHWPATVDLAVVLSDAPDVVEASRTGLEAKLGEVDHDMGVIAIEIGAAPRMDEPTQRYRMTADRFPGLHRR